MTNNDDNLTRQLNRVVLRALREKVKIKCAVVKSSIFEMEREYKCNEDVNTLNQTPLSLKVSIK